jgi:hypothetical protein
MKLDKHGKSLGAHFTCFTGTKVQILTRIRRAQAKWASPTDLKAALVKK